MQVTQETLAIPSPMEELPTVRVYGAGDILLDCATTNYAPNTAHWFMAQYAQQFTHIDLVYPDGTHTVLITTQGE